MDEGMRLAILDEAWSHPYSCRCDICCMGWAILGPSPYDEETPVKDAPYGPFSKQEIEAMAKDRGIRLHPLHSRVKEEPQHA